MSYRMIDLGGGQHICIETDDAISQILDERLTVPINSTERLVGRESRESQITLANQLIGLSKAITDAAKVIEPEQFELTAQIKFSGSAGIPVFVTVKSETSFQIKLTWKK